MEYNNLSDAENSQYKTKNVVNEKLDTIIEKINKYPKSITTEEISNMVLTKIDEKFQELPEELDNDDIQKAMAEALKNSDSLYTKIADTVYAKMQESLLKENDMARILSNVLDNRDTIYHKEVEQAVSDAKLEFERKIEERINELEILNIDEEGDEVGICRRIKKFFKRLIKDSDNKYDEEWQLLKNDLNNIKAEKSRLKKKNNDLENEVLDLKNSLKAEKQSFADYKLDTEKELAKKDKTENELLQKNSNLESEKTSLEQDIEKIKEENKLTLQKNQLEIDEKVTNIRNRFNQEIEQLKEDNVEKVNELEKELSVQKDLKNQYEKTITSFDDSVKPFMQIAKLAYACPSMDYLFNEELGITKSDKLSVEDTIVFVNRFAWEFTFARLVYDSMKRYKEEHKETITEDELKLVKTINTYYKEKYGEQYAEFDALDCLGMDAGAAISFDRKSMMVLNDYQNRNLTTANKLYVPALRMSTGRDIEKKAIIEE